MLEKLNKQILFILFISLLNGQFKDTSIAFDDRLLKSDERSSLFQLENDIKRFYEYTVWNEEYSDLAINLNIQLIFEGSACLLYTSPSPRDATLSRMPSSA